MNVLVALLKQLAVIMEHAQAKKLYFDKFLVCIPNENRLRGKKWLNFLNLVIILTYLRWSWKRRLNEFRLCRC